MPFQILFADGDERREQHRGSEGTIRRAPTLGAGVDKLITTVSQAFQHDRLSLKRLAEGALRVLI